MNKTISSILIYTICFAIASTIADLVFYKETTIDTIITTTYLLGVVIKSLLFGVFMTFFMTRRQKKMSSSEHIQ